MFVDVECTILAMDLMDHVTPEKWGRVEWGLSGLVGILPLLVRTISGIYDKIVQES